MIRLTPITEDEKPLPSKEIRIEGEFVTDVVSHPREVQHGRLPRGTVREESVYLRSLTDRQFRIRKATSKSRDIQISRTEDQDGYIYTLRLVATQLGHQELSVKYEVQDEDGFEYTVAIPVRYYGVDSFLREGVMP